MPGGLPQSSRIFKLFSRLGFEIKVLLLRDRGRKETFLKFKTPGAVHLPISLIESGRLRKLLQITRQVICAIRSSSCSPELGSSEAPTLHQESHALGIPQNWHQMETTPDFPTGAELTGQLKRFCRSENLGFRAELTLGDEWNA